MARRRAPHLPRRCCSHCPRLAQNVDPDRKLVNGAQGTVTGFEAPPPSGPTSAKRARLGTEPISARSGELGGWPLVRFDGTGETLAIQPERWTVQSNALEASFEQVPLMLSWAVSIHKAQGSQFERQGVVPPARSGLALALGCPWPCAPTPPAPTPSPPLSLGLSAICPPAPPRPPRGRLLIPLAPAWRSTCVGVSLRVKCTLRFRALNLPKVST